MSNAALTYGDRFALPSVPGVVWEVQDARSVSDPAPHVRAYARPVEREDGTAIRYDDAIKIGRAERVGVEIRLNADGDHWAGTRGYVTPLTDAQANTLNADANALTFDLPPLTADEIVRRVIASAQDTYVYSAVREATDSLCLPKSYSSTNADYRAVIDALYADPATIPAIRAALVAAFTAELEKWKP